MARRHRSCCSLACEVEALLRQLVHPPAVAGAAAVLRQAWEHRCKEWPHKRRTAFTEILRIMLSVRNFAAWMIPAGMYSIVPSHLPTDHSTLRMNVRPQASTCCRHQGYSVTAAQGKESQTRAENSAGPMPAAATLDSK